MLGLRQARCNIRHQLPSLSDERSYYLTLLPHPHHSNVASNVSFVYTGNGGYDALLTVQEHGPFDLLLRLETVVVPLSGMAICPPERVPFEGTCACAAGYEPQGSRCIACAPDKQKLEAGNFSCTEKPIEVLT